LSRHLLVPADTDQGTWKRARVSELEQPSVSSETDEGQVLFNPTSSNAPDDPRPLCLVLAESLHLEGVAALARVHPYSQLFALIQTQSATAAGGPLGLSEASRALPAGGKYLTFSIIDPLETAPWLCHLSDLRTIESFPPQKRPSLRIPRFAARSFTPSYLETSESLSLQSLEQLYPDLAAEIALRVTTLPSAGEAGRKIVGHIQPTPSELEAALEGIRQLCGLLPGRLGLLNEECERVRNSALLFFSPNILRKLLETLRAVQQLADPRFVEHALVGILISQIEKGEPLSVIVRDRL
jgi:hypothetical protein